MTSEPRCLDKTRLFDQEAAEPVLQRPPIPEVQRGHEEALGGVPVVRPVAQAGEHLLLALAGLDVGAGLVAELHLALGHAGPHLGQRK